jgi:hypothetical protein
MSADHDSRACVVRTVVALIAWQLLRLTLTHG